VNELSAWRILLPVGELVAVGLEDQVAGLSLQHGSEPYYWFHDQEGKGAGIRRESAHAPACQGASTGKPTEIAKNPLFRVKLIVAVRHVKLQPVPWLFPPHSPTGLPPGAIPTGDALINHGQDCQDR